MYCPEYFRELNRENLLALIQAYPLADICYCSTNGVALDYLPLILSSDTGVSIGTDGPHLIGHVARANPMWQLAQDQELILGFNGPQVYISPSAYASKQITGQVVPTWNYLRVQVRATMQIIEAHDEKRRIVEQMTNHFERGLQTPWQLSEAPEAYIERMLEAVVGVRFTMQSMEGKWKVGQNQTPENQATLKTYLQTLSTHESVALLSAMK